MDNKNIWRNWILATSSGELLGFAIPAVIGPAVYFLANKYLGGLSPVLIYAVTAVGGFGEGAVLGAFQSFVLKKYVKDFASSRFIIYTALAAVIAWLLGMTPSTLHIEIWPVSLIIFFAVGASIIFLLSIGTAQWLVLRRYFENALWWIPVNALAWPIGVLVPVVTISLVPDNSSPVLFVVAGIIGGYLMGVLVGIITGFCLKKLKLIT